MSRCRRPILYPLFLFFWCSMLLGCSQDPSQVDPLLLVSPPHEQLLEAAQSDQQVLAEQLGWNDLQPAVLEDNPVSIALAPTQYSDSDLLVALEAEVTSLNGEIRQVHWLQERGPEAIMLDPYQQTTLVWIPPVTERTVLSFRLVAADSQGYLNSAVTQIVVLPLEQAPPVTASITLQDNQLAVNIRLAQAAEQSLELMYHSIPGTAFAGVDYEHTEGYLAFEPGVQTHTVNVPLLESIRYEGRYFYLHLREVLKGESFERMLVIPLPAQQTPFSAKPEASPPIYEGASDQPQAQLEGNQGPMRVHLEWQEEEGEDSTALLQLRVTDPCGEVLHLDQRETVCQEVRGHYDVISEAQPTHNLVWQEVAPAGNYHIALEHLAGPGAEYQLRVFWGDESALYTGYIGPGQQVSVGDFGVDEYDPWLDRVLPRPSQPNANLAAGAWHNLAIDVDGHLWRWGADSHGAIEGPEDPSGVVAVAAGGMHSLALGSSGDVWAWGGNHYGQADVPTDLRDVVALSAGAQHSLALRADGNLIAWGDNSQGQGEAPTALRAVAVASGDYHNLALTDQGLVVAWGDQQWGQTDVPAAMPPITAIAAGAVHSLALTANGRVFAWGANDDGQTSVPEGLEQVVAVAAGAHHSLALKSDGTVVAWGADNFGQATVPENIREVVSISAGEEHSVALTADGLAVAWGNDEQGQSSVPEGLATQQRYESRKHMLLLVLRGGEVNRIQLPVFGEETGCSPITIPEFVAQESGYAVAAATSVHLASPDDVRFSVDGILNALDPVADNLRLYVAGGAVEASDVVSGTFVVTPTISTPQCMGSSFFVPGAHHVSQAWSPTRTNHGLTEVSLSMPEDILPDDLLVLITMHRQDESHGATNRAVLTDPGFRRLAFGNVAARYGSVEEYQFITLWAKKASELDVGRNLSIYSF